MSRLGYTASHEHGAHSGKISGPRSWPTRRPSSASGSATPTGRSATACRRRTGKAGAEIRGRLQELGVYRDTGHEHFNGCLVVPIYNEAGQVVEMYGRKLTRSLRKGTPLHLYLPGPHRGVWNDAGLAGSEEVILCEAPWTR